MSKVEFIIYFFFELSHFKEPCGFIGWQHFGPKMETQSFARYGVGVEISSKILAFTLDYFPEIQKTVFWGNMAILAFFAQIWAKMDFSAKETVLIIKYSNYLPLCYSIIYQKNLICHS